MLYTKQQVADKINSIYASTNKGNYGRGMNLPEIEKVLQKLNNRETISFTYMVTERLGTPNYVTRARIGFEDDDVEVIPEISLKLKMLVLCPFGEAWTDDITFRLMSVSGINYDQSFFDHILNTRFDSYKVNGKHSDMSESELFEKFIKDQNELI